MLRASAHALQGDAGSAVHDFSAVLRLEPQNHEARAQRGRAQTLRGAMEAARKDWRKAADSGHQQAALWLSNHVIEQSDEWVASGRARLAISQLSDALRTDPPNHQLYLKRGKAYQAIGDHGHAIADFSSGMRLNPDDISVLVLRGRSYALTWRKQLAIQDWSYAAQCGDQDARALLQKLRKESEDVENQAPVNAERQSRQAGGPEQPEQSSHTAESHYPETGTDPKPQPSDPGSVRDLQYHYHSCQASDANADIPAVRRLSLLSRLTEASLFFFVVCFVLGWGGYHFVQRLRSVQYPLLPLNQSNPDSRNDN